MKICREWLLTLDHMRSHAHSPLRHSYPHRFFIFKYNYLKFDITPSPDGEGWGEENKICYLYPLIPAFSLREKEHML